MRWLDGITMYHELGEGDGTPLQYSCLSAPGLPLRHALPPSSLLVCSTRVCSCVSVRACRLAPVLCDQEEKTSAAELMCLGR